MSNHVLTTPRAEERPAPPPKVRFFRRANDGSVQAPPARVRTVALGGEPRVSLLPAEVNEYHHAKSVRRRLMAGLVVVVVLVGAGIAGAYLLATSAEAALAASRVAEQDLILQQGQFAELEQVKNGIAVAEAGVLVAQAPEIDWKDYLVKLEATLPDGVVIKTVSVESTTPFEDYPQSSIPLEGSRVATLSFAAVSPTLPSIPDWLNGLSTLAGFADAEPESMSLQADGYLVNIVMHINADAFVNATEEAAK